MKTAEFDFTLPPELIAQHPAERRDQSRLLWLQRSQRQWAHHVFRSLPDFLNPGDLLVANDTRVIPARLFGRKARGGGKVELLLLEERSPGTWEVLLRCRRRPHPGDAILFDGQAGQAILLEDGEMGRALVRFEMATPVPELLQQIGLIPLPPYIQRQERTPRQEAEDRERYQTIFAQAPGAVAAPTAGLHFSDEVLQALAAKGIQRATITLHVGVGTFRPVAVENVADHRMDDERFCISEETAQAIRRTHDAGGRVVAVGTTSLRTLESAADGAGGVRAGAGRTRLFVYPPYSFQVVDVLLTNFHLPRSTLLMLVSAFAGREFILQAYAEAIRERYRFYSYGDCMLIT